MVNYEVLSENTKVWIYQSNKPFKATDIPKVRAKVTEFAAHGASPFIGKGDKNAADKGAVDKMREELNKIDMIGTVVIGEGEMDEAPMLYIGEKVGTKNGPKIDIALDPLEAAVCGSCELLTSQFVMLDFCCNTCFS